MLQEVSVMGMLRQAIDQRRLVRMNYQMYSRLLEPYAIVQGPDGEELLLAWQQSGGCRDGAGTGWKELRLKLIVGLRVLADSYVERTLPPPWNDLRGAAATVAAGMPAA